MLQQILKDMWVDPDILAELDEGQKQTLFCKMREEQVRRWRVWDEKSTDDEPKPTKVTLKPKKSVNFLTGSDGEPWTWVMGDHPDDKTIEIIIEEEARELARKQAEKEAEELRKSVEKQLNEFIELPKITDFVECQKDSIIDDPMEIYCSVDELREKMQKQNINNKFNNTCNNKPLSKLNNFTFNNNSLNKKFVNFNNISNFVDKRDVLNEITLNKPVKVAQKVALWEKRLMEERATEILKKLQKKQLEAAKEAEEFERIQETLWKEQGKLFFRFLNE